MQTDLLVKAEMVRQIASIIEHRHLTHTAAEILGARQPQVSRLLNGHIEDFSMDRLFSFLRALGRDVEIRVKTKPKSHARPAVGGYFGVAARRRGRDWTGQRGHGIEPRPRAFFVRIPARRGVGATSNQRALPP